MTRLLRLPTTATPGSERPPAGEVGRAGWRRTTPARTHPSPTDSRGHGFPIGDR